MDDMRRRGIDFRHGQYLQRRRALSRSRNSVLGRVQGLFRDRPGQGFLLVAASPLTRSGYPACDDFRKNAGSAIGAIVVGGGAATP